jgi:hypothetical protein
MGVSIVCFRQIAKKQGSGLDVRDGPVHGRRHRRVRSLAVPVEV